MTLLSFINVCKDLRTQGDLTDKSRERLVASFFMVNERSRAYYLEEKTKQLFSRCLRLFFSY
jgi:hypothetical protein